MGKVIAVSISEKKGTKKRNVDSMELKENSGVVGDAHAQGSQYKFQLRFALTRNYG